MKVGTLIQILQRYNPESEVRYILSDNNSVKVATVKTYYINHNGEQTLGLYFQTRGEQNGRPIIENIG